MEISFRSSARASLGVDWELRPIDHSLLDELRDDLPTQLTGAIPHPARTGP